MLRRLGILAAMLALSMLLASPAFAQDSLAERIIERVFNNVFDSPSETTYDRPGDDGPVAGVPPRAERALCANIVRNRAVPRFIQVRIARTFGLPCRPAGSFLAGFFR